MRSHAPARELLHAYGPCRPASPLSHLPALSLFQPCVQEEINQALTHELVHAYDHCRAGNLDWTNCQHHACSEIRAAALSGKCTASLFGVCCILLQQHACSEIRAAVWLGAP